MTYKLPVSVLVLVHTAELQVLLLERADRPGFWQSVTGSLHAGETLLQTAQRELAEETGIIAAPGTLVDWQRQNRFEIYVHWRSRYAPGVTHNTEHVFGLTLPAAQDIVLAPRAPKTVWLEPPKAAPISAPFPDWRRITPTMTKATIMWRMVRAVYMV